jgi:hypothetical protein
MRTLTRAREDAVALYKARQARVDTQAKQQRAARRKTPPNGRK